MKQEILANCTPDETRVAVVEDGKLVELGIERKESEKIIGNIYKGKVENVLPGISSAFVSIGLEKNAYLYISDVVGQQIGHPGEETPENEDDDMDQELDADEAQSPEGMAQEPSGAALAAVEAGEPSQIQEPGQIQDPAQSPEQGQGQSQGGQQGRQGDHRRGGHPQRQDGRHGRNQGRDGGRRGRGGRGRNRNHPASNQHSVNKHIEQCLKKNDIIMVQVAKEAIGTKGVKVTMDISLPGRFLVYLPFQHTIGISKNIEEEPERRRLKDLLDRLRPKQGGFIVRTEAEGIEEREMKREIRYLNRLWENIQRRFHSSPPATLIHRDLGLVFQTVRDILSEDTVVFMIDNKHEQHEAQDFVQMLSPELADRVKPFEGKTPIFEAFNVDKELETLLQSRISLPSGGTIIIQEAESLCAIDVNTGKFTGKESQEETVTQTNIEAADEVARQLRLRNIGGIIVIDFIDMRRARNRQKVVEALHRATSRDRAKIKILPITRLGLVEMTRERKRESMLATLCQTCSECRGIGMVLSNESLFIKVKKEILKLTNGRPQGKMRLVLHPEVAAYFKERKEDLNRSINRECEIQMDGTLRYDDYKIIIE